MRMGGFRKKGYLIPAVIVSFAFMLAASVASMLWGASSVSAPDFIAWISGAEVSPSTENILLHVRLPRLCAALLSGAALAIAGTIIQAVLNNPLASPNVIGINSGAGLAVLLAAVIFPNIGWISPIAAFLGALATAGIIFSIAMGPDTSKLTVVLAGIAITTVFGAGINTILIVDPDAYVNSATFLVGGLGGVLLKDLVWPAAYIAFGAAIALLSGTRLNIMALGDDVAHGLGLNVTISRFVLLGLAALLAGAAVSFAGLLSFVGLIVPHLVRFFVGNDNRRVIPVAALVGAGFVTACDLLARVLFAPYEVPVGILMAFLGGPFFIYLILTSRKHGLE